MKQGIQPLLLVVLLNAAGCAVPAGASSSGTDDSPINTTPTPVSSTNNPGPSSGIRELVGYGGASYTLGSFAGSLVLALTGGSTNPGTTLLQSNPTGQSTQVWRFDTIGTGQNMYAIHLSESDMCVESQTLTTGGSLVIEPCDQSLGQEWLLDLDGNTLVIENAESRLCMAVQAAGTADNALVVQDTCLGNPAAQWTLLPKTLTTTFPAVGFMTSPTNYLVSLSGQIVVTKSLASNPNLTGGAYLYMFPDGGNPTFNPIGQDLLGALVGWSPIGGQSKPSWWNRGIYNNNNSSETDPNYAGIIVSQYMAVSVGDVIDVSMVLDGNTWIINSTDVNTNQTVSFNQDMGGQTFNGISASLQMDNGSMSAAPETFTNLSFTAAFADPTLCVPWLLRTSKDTITQATLSANQRTCTIAQINLNPP